MKPLTSGAMALTALSAAAALAMVSFRAVGVEAVYPVEKAGQSFARRVWSRVVGVFNASEAAAENVRLRREVAALSLVRQDMERLEAENARLRGVLEYKARRAGEWLPAGVLSEGGGAAGMRRIVRIDKGSGDGVVKNAVVVVPEGLVGKVESVTPCTAEVRLLPDPGLKVACNVEIPGHAPMRGILYGGGGDTLVLRLEAASGEPPPRSRVVTSGAGGVFPSGIEVGSYLGGGLVAPSADFSSLEDVFIRRAK